ncbi:MAG: hypothetical protein LBB78_04310 [Spirochaetaceae bacterium]|jgi:hypothetical protein|nr:hypothetical protein [Spirochaetaceae bacterium]
MARKSILQNDRFVFKLYLRTLPSGPVYSKESKRESAGIVPMADELADALMALKRVASILKFDNDNQNRPRKVLGCLTPYEVFSP